jgi:hypothetical protein
MNETKRRFTFGNLEIRKLSISDYLFLSAYAISIAVNFYCIFFHPYYIFNVSLFIAFAAGFLTISTTFGLRFQNISFSLIWLTLSSVFTIKNFPISYIPLATFLLYHILRLLFWKENKREFIPFEVGKGGSMHRYRSKIENRVGSNKDKDYMRFLLWIGIIVILTITFQMVGVKIR